MKKDRNTKRLNRINEERVQILGAARESILKSNDKNNENIGSYISNNFDYNDTISSLKAMISNLVEEASKANSDEEIIKLRNRINYYVKKLKAELKKRNVTEEEYNKIYSSIIDVRKNIATLVRYEKRKHNIDRINELNNRYETLSLEELSELSKLLSNERSYNRRAIRKINCEEEKKKPKEEVKEENPFKFEPKEEQFEEHEEIIENDQSENKRELSVDEIIKGYGYTPVSREDLNLDEIKKIIETASPYEETTSTKEVPVIEVPTKEDKIDQFTLDLSSEVTLKKEIDVEEIRRIIIDKFNKADEEPAVLPQPKATYDTGEASLAKRSGRFDFENENSVFHDFLEGRITREEFIKIRSNRYMRIYRTKNPHKYTRNVFVNFFNLIRNIPIYSANQRVIRPAKEEYSCFYGGDDLRGFLDYSIKRNSIDYGFKAAFNSKEITDEEKELLSNPKKCSDWILTYSRVK